jgi:hypothetical protein
MPFHVELRRGFQRASAFNLDQGKLRQVVLDPWRRGRPVELGEREWDPRESSLQILEGPELAPPDLAMGRGWHNAERSSRNVTAELLERLAVEASSVAVLAATAPAREAASEILNRLGVPEADWEGMRARILAGSTAVADSPPDLEAGAVLLVAAGPDPDPSWRFEAGLALGALGGRASLVLLGDEPPPSPLGELAAIRLDPEREETLQALAERLRGLARTKSR